MCVRIQHRKYGNIIQHFKAVSVTLSNYRDIAEYLFFCSTNYIVNTALNLTFPEII